MKQFRKLPWTDPEVSYDDNNNNYTMLQVFNWAVMGLSEIWLVKFSSIHCVADILSGLKGYQCKPVVWVIDATLEDIRIGNVYIMCIDTY